MQGAAEGGGGEGAVELKANNTTVRTIRSRSRREEIVLWKRNTELRRFTFVLCYSK